MIYWRDNINLLIFGGQDSLKKSDLKQIMKKKEGQELIKDLINADRFDLVNEIYEMIHGLMSPLYYGMFSTYISNDLYYRRINNNNICIDSYSSYSIGIFNIFSAYYSMNTEDMLDFINDRCKLFSKYCDDKNLFMYLSNNWIDLLQIYKNEGLEFDESIIYDQSSGVISADIDTIKKMKEIADRTKFDIKFHKTNILIPYHSKYMEKFQQEYYIILNSLFSKKKKENRLNLIMETNNIDQEIKRQLCGKINLNFILNKIYNDNFETIFDSSLNEFLYKKINISKISNKSKRVGDLLWKMK